MAKATQPGGFVYFDFPHTFGSMYQDLREWLAFVQHTAPYEYVIICGCSGEPRPENLSFFLPGEAESILKRQNFDILFAGETWAPEPGNNWGVVARRRP